MPGSRHKIPLEKNVLVAAKERLEWTFEHFSRICLSLSGGKDSTLMLHLAADVARKKNRTFSVLFIDWEAQFTLTINHIEQLRETYQAVIEHFYWVALPLTTLNSVSQLQPEWICWQPGCEWIRQPPPDAIQQPDFFPFYRPAMTFEDFVLAFNHWFADRQPAAILVGIRADESYQRFLAIVSQGKMRYADDKPWTTASRERYAYNVYPLYDWKTADIWTWFARSQQRHNPLYDLMYQAGVPLRHMRICEPFGPEQRQGLWLYHVIEPERWSTLCQRVSGANCGGLYANVTGDFYANRVLRKPVHHTWKRYAFFLMDSMPPATAEHYRNKIAIYLHWYRSHGFPDDIPEEQDKDLGSRDIPSWRRICRVLLKNDYWCRALSFSPNKPSHYARYNQRIKEKRKKWGLL
ncbi:MAG: phosphoadenosine phosphosulfate reductase [Enterobacterales bacterium]|uniref:phosphoadenosine phosphosulfate reductase n=1 Tax=Serratia sp. (in: enterobacteria) TaxID=616 RepID=UPI003F41072F